MKEMLAFNIARDTMHQEQWLAVLEELGPKALPIPNSFPESKQDNANAYNFLITTTDGIGSQANQPWTSGKAPDGRGTFTVEMAKPMGYVPDLGMSRPDTFGETEQSAGTLDSIVQKGKDIANNLLHGGK